MNNNNRFGHAFRCQEVCTSTLLAAPELPPSECDCSNLVGKCTNLGPWARTFPSSVLSGCAWCVVLRPGGVLHASVFFSW